MTVDMKKAMAKLEATYAACPECGSHNDNEWEGTVTEAYVEVRMVDGRPEAQCNSWAGDVTIHCGICGWEGDYEECVEYDAANDKDLNGEDIE
jgi:hypothetical protein